MANRFSRLASIGSTAVGVGANYLGQRVTGLFQDEATRKEGLARAHRENAERIVANLGQLKGAAMKVGQTVAMFASSFEMPEEARAVLGRLNDKVEPIPFDRIRTRVEAELNGDLASLFGSFDPEPLGTASLGQAHAATLPDGTSVVVKVLHDGVESSVGSDLAALKTVMVTGRALNREKEELDAIFAELQARLTEELDYRIEATNLEDFRGYFAGDPDVVIPAVYRGWSTSKVLTMERLTGRPLAVFAATGSEAARQRAANTLTRVFMQMEYVFRAIHADPHPGNYLFSPDGKLGILDFGCVRRYDLDWMCDYGHIGWHSIRGEREAAMAYAHRVGALRRRDKAAEDVLWEVCQIISEPFMGGPMQLGGNQDGVQERLIELKMRVMGQDALRAPRELVYLHRGLGGTYAILRQLKGRVDFREMFLATTAVCFADAEKAGWKPA
jgi:predicted unusual protein kinase regulating ubiquinone biosynthesis (AarF/ABC1/UbiB family)